MTFSEEEISWLSETIRMLYAACSTPELALGMIASIHVRFRLVASSCDEGSNDGSRYWLHGLRADGVLPEAGAAPFIHDHPPVKLLFTGARPSTIWVNAMVSRTEWERTEYFNNVARVVGFEDQIMAVFHTGETFGAVGFQRDMVFTDREHVLVQMIQPHLQAAWCRLRRLATDDHRHTPGTILLSSRLRPLEMPIGARLALQRHFPAWDPAHGLPEEIERWLRASLWELNRGMSARPLFAYRSSSTPGQLWVRCFPQSAGRGVLLRLLEEFRPAPHLTDLSRREAEVMHWLAQGKRDAEIAVILGLAPKTVAKHVEHLLAKLHVTNRTAAVAATKTDG